MTALSSYKLAVPQVAGHVVSERLVAGLTNSFAGRPLVWLQGLPGAGKTSLAAQFAQPARAPGERCVWYRLDEDDVDLGGMLAALRAHPLLASLDLPGWSPEEQDDARAFARRFFAQLASLGQLLLVFDDCHRVPDASTFFELVDAAREACGDRLRLLLVSRRPPPAALARGLLAGWLAAFDDLALTSTEAAAVAELAAGRPLSAHEVTRLQAAKGWMAHVLALARPRGPTAEGSARALALDGQAHARVGDFLCDELLLMLPASDRRAFALLAELPEVPRRLAGERRVGAGLARFLDTLAEARYFVDVTLVDAWRMHDLLRDALRARNEASFDAPTLAAERRKRAGWIAASTPDSAMNLLVAACDADGALDLLRRHAAKWLAEGRHRQVITWTGEFVGDEPAPGLTADQEAKWWLLRAEALLPLEPEVSRPLFSRSRRHWVACAGTGASRPDLAYRAWCGEVASYVVQWGAVHGLAELVDDLEQIEQRLGPAPGDWRFRTAADALTALMYGRAEDPRIVHYAKATALAVDQAPDANSRIAAAAQLLIYRLWWAGDYPAGRVLYNSFDDEVDHDDTLTPLSRLLWWSNSAIIDWQCGDPQRCYDKVERGLALAESSGVHVRDFFLLTQGIFCALSQEDWPRADAYLARLAQTERGHKRLDTMVHHFFRSWNCMCHGDAPTARAHAEAALPMAEALGSLFHRVIVLSALAPARLHSGDMPGALEAYRAQLALAKSANNPTFAYIAFCAGAEIAILTGDTERLKTQLWRILATKEMGGFHSDCGWRTPMRARWLAAALEHGILPDIARQWIREKKIPRPDGWAGEWPASVTILALEGLTVEVDGRPRAPDGAKPSPRLRELLAILVVQRGGATQVALQDWLWPQAEGDKAAGALKTAVHRLRKWLGNDAVVVRDGTVAINPQRVACDLWQWMDAGKTLPATVLAGCNAPPVEALRVRVTRGS